MKYIINFIKGIAVGIATLVPGVSGGTMSIILGIYDGLIHGYNELNQKEKIRLHISDNRLCNCLFDVL